MAETIEAFVAKLQTEGVETGRREAQKLVTEAQRNAQQILEDAKEQAEKTLAEAKAKAEAETEKTQAELRLAARDTVLRLRDTLSGLVATVLTHATQEVLSDSNFLRQLIHDMALEYAKADREGRHVTQIAVPPETRKQLADWILHEVAHKDGVGKVDLKETLREAGFEYKTDGATVEVTTASVAAALQDLVGPTLRKMLEEATKNST